MSFYRNADILRMHGMDRENDEKEINIYANADPIDQCGVRTETENTRRDQTPQHTGSDSVKSRISRAAPVCLVLLCFLLLTAVIVLSVLIYTNNTNYTHKRNQLLTNITNITEERYELLIRNIDVTKNREQLLTKERDQLLTNNSDLTNERDQLLTRNNDVTKERDQLLTRNNDVTKERDQLLTRNNDVTKERDQLQIKNTQLAKEKEELSSNYNELIKQRDRLNQQKNELKIDGWMYYKSSVYFISSEKKSWTESRKYCRERGADLVIIKNKEKQDFLKKIAACVRVWIGLTDSDVEDTWKWVDGSAVTTTYWNNKEPQGGKIENCVLNDSGWADYPCDSTHQWICEKKI